MESIKKMAKKPIVGIIVETTIPPVSRANLRLYRVAKKLKEKYNVQINMVTPSTTPFSRKSVYMEGIFMNQYWGASVLLYSFLRLPVRIWHFIATIFSFLYLHKFYKDRNGVRLLHAWNPLAGFCAVVIGKRIKRPVFVDFTDFYSDIARTDMKLMASLLLKIELFVLKNAEIVFVVSEEMVDKLAEIGIAKDKIKVVPDGTDDQMFHPNVSCAWIRKEFDIKEEDPLLIYHGDIKYDDGVDILFKAFALVLKKQPNARLLLLGGGGSYFKKLSKLLDELKLRNSVILSGWVPHDTVPQYICASDIGVMPMRKSLNHDCYLSFKLFEYWGCGKPVVSTKLKAISKIVKDGVNGYTVESEDVEGFAQGIIKLIENREQAKEMGMAGRKLVEEEFNWNTIMEKEVQFYAPYLEEKE